MEHLPTIPGPMDTSGPYTVTNTVYLGPFTTKTADHTTETTTTLTTLPPIIVPSDLKGSMTIPTTLITDTDVHEAPSVTEWESTDCTDCSTMSSLTDNGTAGPPTGSTSIMTTIGTATGMPMDTAAAKTVLVLATPTARSAAALEPQGGLSKLSTTLLGIWVLTFVATWL
ncbi:unnamed protein product [Discula destructiva]